VYAGDARYDLFRFADNKLSSQIENGFHAMAIDELRIDFPVARWDAREGIRQVWFAGAHSDVGGGYLQAECGLSDIGLGWMMEQLTTVGVSFATPLTYSSDRQRFDQAIHEPWKQPPFHLLKTSPRQVQPEDSIHESVIKRYQTIAAYRPGALAVWAEKNAAAA
jgi:glutathione S-transferase